ncbi:MAG: transglutaminase-like domain-containing protein [Fibrobacter sp.]|nr:transglutaminase-like domain-containing protein [Fibrobacter sp.]
MRRLFWPLFLIAVAVALALVMWSGRAEKMSYREMACVFEERGLGCIDSIEEWNRGLAYFDSSVMATQDTLSALKNLLWNFWNIDFAGAGDAAVQRESILPLQVLALKKSGCIGLAWLAMMVAEARNLPLETILLPGHVFLRYEGVNLEPNRRGFSYTDEEYREKYKDGPWTGLELEPLTSSQFMGLAAFNMGNLYLESEPRRALTWYRMAEEFFPDYPGIEANQNVAKAKLPDSL